MKINLDRFSQPKEVIIPIVNGYGIWRSRNILFSGEPRNGFLILNVGDEVTLIREANEIEKDQLLSKLPLMRGIAYGDSIIPLNFDQAKFLGYEETNPVYFVNSELGMVIKVRRWEDSTLFFHEVDSSFQDQLLIIGVKERAEKKQPIEGVKGITPEMRYFYLLLTLDLQRIEEWKDLDKLTLSKTEREKRIKQFQESFAGRLQKALEDAGGKLVRFNKRGNWVGVIWKVGREEFHSTIQQDFKILELGFCAEGHDKDHSISSAVLLAKQFIDEGLIYKTRE